MSSFGTYSDKQLLSLLAEGNEQAFSEIYERYWDKLLVYVGRVTQHQNDAQDIVQDLFISLWRRGRSLEIEGALSTYLYNSARYGTLKHIENNLSRSAHLQKLASYLQPTQNKPQTDVESDIFSRELSAKIKLAIEAMPVKMREVFLLSRQQQLSYKEIAQKLSISEETVKKQVYKALKQLRESIGINSFYILIAITTYFLKKYM